MQCSGINQFPKCIQSRDIEPVSIIANINIYIVIHRQTVSFYQNSSVWLDTQDARSRDRNPSKRTMLAKGIFKVFI